MTQSSLQMSPWNLNTGFDLLCINLCLCACVCLEECNYVTVHVCNVVCLLLCAGCWACFCTVALMFSAMSSTLLPGQQSVTQLCDSWLSSSMALTGKWAHPNPLNPTFYLITSRPSTPWITPEYYLDLFGVFKQEYCIEALHFPISIRL